MPALVHETQGRIVSTATSSHTIGDPNVRFLGVLKVAAADRAALADVAGTVAEADDPASRTLGGLVRTGVAVTAVQLRELFWAQPRSQADAARAAGELAGLDEDRLLLDSAVKANDSFFTTFLVSPYSKYIARWAARCCCARA